MSNFVSGVGPLFGPNSVVVTVNDETGKPLSLQVYPDAHNPELRAAGMPTQYYFQPSRIMLARKQGSPEDFDFEMTLFKGLMSEETTITPQELAQKELGGGFCTFSTTFGIPPNVIQQVREKIKKQEHDTPNERFGAFFNYQQNDPEPNVGIIPITSSTVVCAVQDPAVSGNVIQMKADYNGKGSIEAQGINSFLVSCNLAAAGLIASALKAGGSPPFLVMNTLEEMFYINGVTVEVEVDVDKVYDSFSAAVSTGSFFGITDINAEFAYSSCLTNGGITTKISMNSGVLDDPTKKWIMDNVVTMRQTAVELVKKEIFDWDPAKADTKASTAGRSWFSQIFGGSSVSLKSTHERKGIRFKEKIILDQAYTATHAVSGDLNELLPAVRANLNKYLFIVDIGEFFKKVQVAAVCMVDFDDKLDDGTVLDDPVQAVQLEAGYPDFSQPVQDGKPNLHMRGQGQHYIIGSDKPKTSDQPAIWTRDNAKDIVNISFLRLDTPVDGWPSDQVRLRRKIIFDGQDPRVNLSKAIAPNDPAIAEIEVDNNDHAPTLTASMVGHVFVRFMPVQKLPPNITVEITPTIGADTYAPITITKDNEKNALWEIYSDKYVMEDHFTYTMTVTVVGPNFTDEVIVYSTPEPVKVPVAQGHIKYVPKSSVMLPDPPDDKLPLINDYIKKATEAAATA